MMSAGVVSAGDGEGPLLSSDPTSEKSKVAAEPDATVDAGRSAVGLPRSPA